MPSPSTQQGGFSSGEFAPVSYDTSAPSYRKVEFLRKAGSGTYVDNGCFVLSGKKILHCYYRCGRTVHVIGDDNGSLTLDYSSTTGNEYLFLVITYNSENQDYSAELVWQDDAKQDNNDTTTAIPLYKFKNGSVEIDFRNMPAVPFYE